MGFGWLSEQVVFRGKDGDFSGPVSRRGKQTACLSSSPSVNSAHGRARNASVAESFSTAGPCPAASAEPAHIAGTAARAPQSGSAGDGNEPGSGGTRYRSRRAGRKETGDF